MKLPSKENQITIIGMTVAAFMGSSTIRATQSIWALGIVAPLGWLIGVETSRLSAQQREKADALAYLKKLKKELNL